MPIMPQYRSPYGQSILELLAGQGDAAARAAQRSGMLWGNAVQNIGQIGAQAFEQHAEKKDQQKRELILDDALTTFDPTNPGMSYRKLATGLGPQHATRVMSTMVSLYKMQQGEKPDPKLVVSGLAALEEKTPGYLEKNWATGVGERLVPIADMFGMALDPTTPPEGFGQQLLALNAGINGSKGDDGGAIVETFDERGNRVKRRATGAELLVGVPVPGAEAKEPAPGSIEAFVAAKYPQGATPEQMLSARAEWARADDKPRDPLAAAMAQARIDALEEKGKERQEEIEAYVNALGRGDYTIDKVPPTIGRQVMVEAEKRGLDTRTGPQRDLDSSAEQTIESLRQLREQATKTMTATTGPGAKVQGSLQRGLSYVGLAEETQKWDKQTAKLSILARQLGEKGVLTDRDVERIVNMLPKLTEKVSIRNDALKDIEDIIFTGLRGRVSGKVTLPEGAGVKVEVTAPNGKTYTFASQERADAAKKAWGMP